MDTDKKVQTLIAAIKEQWSHGFTSFDGEPPLWDDKDFTISDGSPYCARTVKVIYWESGPAEWAFSFPGGGVDPEHGFAVKAVEVAGLTSGEDFEPEMSFALAVY